MGTLTEKQQNIFDYIKEFIDKSGGQPTYREIASEFGITFSAVHSHIELMERKGFLRRQGYARGLRILKK